MTGPGPRSVGDVLAASRLVLVCGSGGVGKTTASAAMGIAAARHSARRVLVITVDPARRLADALGIATASFAGAGAVRVEPPDGDTWKGTLSVAMLDTKAGWDELIRRHAPDPVLAERVLSNPLYHNITSRFVNSHDYLAMEQLHHLDARRDHDLVIVDTPPSRHALDLVDAPRRMREFFASALLRWLTVPARSRLLTAASRPFNAVAERILGTGFLQDIVDFFVLLRAMEPGFVERAAEVERLLAADRTAFVLVTTCEDSPMGEARYFADELRRRRLPLRAVVLNRVLPDAVRSESASAAASAISSPATVASLADATEVAAVEPAALAHVLGEVGRRFGEVRDRAVAEHGRRLALEGHLAANGAAPAVVVAVVPDLAGDVHDLSGVAAMAATLSG
jgi:anion-transporting  ArsA/GET3 family ATPase